ncbi:MAG: hypothetical protein KDE53_28235, partial [Caldilineaceae bacterium]|nr:hypothetical protein [Caldilineaceae bacterium]
STFGSYFHQFLVLTLGTTLANTELQTEAEMSCVDGCPACIQISMCTERNEQEHVVSRVIGEKILQYFHRQFTQEQIDTINFRRVTDMLFWVKVTKKDSSLSYGFK